MNRYKSEIAWRQKEFLLSIDNDQCWHLYPFIENGDIPLDTLEDDCLVAQIVANKVIQKLIEME